VIVKLYGIVNPQYVISLDSFVSQIKINDEITDECNIPSTLTITPGWIKISSATFSSPLVDELT